MNTKEVLRVLIEFFNSKFDKSFDDAIFELNGYEGLIVYGSDGMFYQMSFKSADVWNISMWPYDIYGKRVWNGKEWMDK